MKRCVCHGIKRNSPSTWIRHRKCVIIMPLSEAWFGGVCWLKIGVLEAANGGDADTEAVMGFPELCGSGLVIFRGCFCSDYFVRFFAVYLVKRIGFGTLQLDVSRSVVRTSNRTWL
jgi:hypothetical protein